MVENIVHDYVTARTILFAGLASMVLCRANNVLCYIETPVSGAVEQPVC